MVLGIRKDTRFSVLINKKESLLIKKMYLQNYIKKE